MEIQKSQFVTIRNCYWNIFDFVTLSVNLLYIDELRDNLREIRQRIRSYSDNFERLKFLEFLRQLRDFILSYA
jgi:hypothetical protein